MTKGSCASASKAQFCGGEVVGAAGRPKEPGGPREPADEAAMQSNLPRSLPLAGTATTETSINRRMDRQKVVFPHKGASFSRKRERSPAPCCNMDGPQKRVECKEPDPQSHISHDPTSTKRPE